jgi:hypothetical protein
MQTWRVQDLSFDIIHPRKKGNERFSHTYLVIPILPGSMSFARNDDCSDASCYHTRTDLILRPRHPQYRRQSESSPFPTKYTFAKIASTTPAAQRARVQYYHHYQNHHVDNTSPPPSPLVPSHPAGPAVQHQHRNWQTAIFRAAAPVVLFSILITYLLIELRTRLAPPLPDAPPVPGLQITVSMHADPDSDTVLHRAILWAESRWRGAGGAWALPLLCAGALGALRAVIWTCASVLDGLTRRTEAVQARRVWVGRWEDGRSLTGNELLAEMFT